MKAEEKYIKLYMQKCEENLEGFGYCYPPRNWDEFEKWNTDTFQKYLAKYEPNSVLATKSYISLLHHTKDFGFLQAIQSRDYALLNNVLYQTSRQRLLDCGMTASGGDEGRILFVILPAFACNDFSLIDRVLPNALPTAKGDHYLGISTNLFKAIYYKQDKFLDEAIERANIFLEKKQTLWTKYFVSYFLALASKDSGQLEVSLQELSSAYQKLDKFIASNLDKCFSAPIHGLYRLVKFFDEELFAKIKRPQHSSFWAGFEDWQAENVYPLGKLFYAYPKEMKYLNAILAAEVPIINLTNPQSLKGKLYIDEKRFAADLTENVSKIHR